MTKLQKIALLLVPAVMLALYIFSLPTDKKEQIIIEPIKINTPNPIKDNALLQKSIEEDPKNILSKLKTAANASIEGIIIPKETVQNNVLNSLKKKIAQQETKKITVHKKLPTTKKIVSKKIINKKIVIKKEPKVKSKEKQSAKKKTKIVHKKIQETQKPKEITQVKVVKTKLKAKEKLSKLTREEEVALYKNKYTSTLEVVNVSESFEINEENPLPDSYYFEAVEPSKSVDNNQPLVFAEKLGIVDVSDKYESNFTVPKKIEIAKEGIVNISNASIETKEMKNLKFVDTLGVVEVSKDFETIEAKQYLE